MPASPDPRVATYLSRGGSALASLSPVVTAVSGPAGVAVAIVGALAGLAGDAMAGGGAPVTRAEDPGPLLDAMKARWAARAAAAAAAKEHKK